MLDKSNKRDSVLVHSDSILQLSSFKNYDEKEHIIPFKPKVPAVEGYSVSTPGSLKMFF
jgi:hypothetical protein